MIKTETLAFIREHETNKILHLEETPDKEAMIGQMLQDFAATMQQRIDYLETLINSPEINDFIKAVRLESAHQTERWGLENEEASPPHHFVLVFAKLLGKMSTDIFDRDKSKYKHHLITIAAEMYNVHRQVEKKGTFIHKWFNEPSK